MLSLLFDSYAAWPLSSLMPVVASPLLVELLLKALAQLLTTALTVAAPFVIMMLLIEVAFGLLSRFAPLLNVFFVVLPLKVLALAVMLLLYGMVVGEQRVADTAGRLLRFARIAARNLEDAVSEQESSQAKTEPPTQKRLRDLASQGAGREEPGCRGDGRDHRRRVLLRVRR